MNIKKLKEAAIHASLHPIVDPTVATYTIDSVAPTEVKSGVLSVVRRHVYFNIGFAVSEAVRQAVIEEMQF